MSKDKDPRHIDYSKNNQMVVIDFLKDKLINTGECVIIRKGDKANKAVFVSDLLVEYGNRFAHSSNLSLLEGLKIKMEKELFTDTNHTQFNMGLKIAIDLINQQINKVKLLKQ